MTPDDSAFQSTGQDLGAPEQTSCRRAIHVHNGLLKAAFRQLAMGAAKGNNAYDDD
jgi:hypothetical protein